LLILPTRITGGPLVDLLCMDTSSSLLVGDNVGDDAAMAIEDTGSVADT
jgi:hypothetical protein